MDKFILNIFIELSNKGTARSRLAAGMYTMEYLLKNGTAETRQGLLIRENVTGNALALETLEGAFKRLTKACQITVNMENPHILNVMNNHYLSTWEKNNWIRYNGKQVANRELWQQVSESVKEHTIVFISGHHSYRKRMQFDMEKAMEAFKNGEEYNPTGKCKRVPVMPAGSTEYWILW